ncbi:MAG: twin-arginine translocase TatA/TatE family subunit [Rikenellaceae bacterium]|nr:twin-arginine translocase TatA/TatE family subunit [Rikenellaceae bacterium]
MAGLTVIPLGLIGTQEIILIVVLVVLLFGAKKIPELMRGAGRGVKEFKDAVNKDYSEEDKKDKKESEEEDK